MQIFQQIRKQILSGELVQGYQLPPERKLAQSLNVNRTTVLNAYRELKAEGLVGSRVGQGTVVLSHINEGISVDISRHEPSWNQIFSQYSSGFSSLLAKELLTLANRNDVISFATGIASPDFGPIELFKNIDSELINKTNHRALLHSPVEGFAQLRDLIRSIMQRRGIYCNNDEIMVLSGSQQGIDLAARLILDPGDIVVVEEPSFFLAVQTFRAAGARVIGIPVDDNGMRVDMLEQLLQRYRPKLIYTMPTFQNPTGVEMPLERRKSLVELAHKYRVIILEDDAYADLCYDGQVIPKLKSLENEGYVIYLSSFSKITYPGLRMGWMAAHRQVIKRFAAVKQTMDLHSSSLSQWLIERFIASGGLDRHIPHICSEYSIKRDTMYQALIKHAPKGMEWNKPKGGYYIWCKLPDGVPSSKLISKAAQYKVAFVPGSTFFTEVQVDNYIRLNYTFSSLNNIEEGIRRLCKAIKDVLSSESKQEVIEDLEINPIV